MKSDVWGRVTWGPSQLWEDCTPQSVVMKYFEAQNKEKKQPEVGDRWGGLLVLSFFVPKGKKGKAVLVFVASFLD